MKRVNQFDQKYQKLNYAMIQLLNDFSQIALRKLDISDEDSIRDLLLETDEMIQVISIYKNKLNYKTQMNFTLFKKNLFI